MLGSPLYKYTPRPVPVAHLPIHIRPLTPGFNFGHREAAVIQQPVPETKQKSDKILIY